jgi:hypothetical protein
MSDLPKPSILELSKWELDYYSIRMPTVSKKEFIAARTRQWYRHQWHLRNNK